jgi:hypothetical protein
MGWRISPGKAKQNGKLIDTVVGQRLNDLIDPGSGILADVSTRFDFALHDLAGIVFEMSCENEASGGGVRHSSSASQSLRQTCTC